MSFIDFSPLKSVLIFIACLWAIFFLESIFPIARFGIHPRQLDGLIGILTSPFIHENVQHLVANSIGILIFGVFCGLVEGRRMFEVVAGVILIGGSLTWLLARSANHIGASGLIFGLFGYLIFVGFFHRRWNFILASFVCLAAFGSMIFGVLPRSPSVSWEGHLFGFFAGFLMAKWRG